MDMKRSSNKILLNLESFRKVELYDIQHFFGAGLSKRYRKDEMVSKLGALIIERPKKWLCRMLERDLRLLKMLIDAGPEVKVSLNYPEYPSILETVLLIDTDTSDVSRRRLSISKDFYDVTSPYIDYALEQGEKSGRFKMERAALGYLALYGVMTIDMFAKKMNDFRLAETDEDPVAFGRLLVNSPVCKICTYDSDYMTFPSIDDPKVILDGRKDFKEIRSFKQFKPKDALRAGENAPYFRFGLGTKEGRGVAKMLRSLGYSEQEIAEEEHFMWMNSQMERKPDNTEAVFASVLRRQDSLNTFEEFKECMQAVAAYSNSLPKWMLCGYSPNEVNLMKVVLRAGMDPYEEIRKMNPAFGLYVHPVDPDAPCPCGSGLSYKFCHGRYLN